MVDMPGDQDPAEVLDWLTCGAECVPPVSGSGCGASRAGSGELLAQELEAQLGRKPRWVKGVVVACAMGHPVVFATYPVDPEAPGPEVFPTLYWLSCPALVRMVSELESKGGVALAEELARRDPGFAERLRRAHDAYARERVEFAAAGVPNEACSCSRASVRASLVGSGVGGVRRRSAGRHGVKCLHAHLAHYLAQAARRASAGDGGLNPVGEWVACRLGLEPPGPR